MKRILYMMAITSLIATALFGCNGNSAGSNQAAAENYVNRYPGEYNTELSDYSNIQIKDKDGNDISHIAVDLWYAANEIYNVDDMKMFEIGEYETNLTEYDIPQSNELKNYNAVVENVLTQNGITQLEQAMIDGRTPLIRKKDNKVYRMGAWKTGYSFAKTLTDMKVKELSGDTITLEAIYALVDMESNILDAVDVNFTITNVNGTWLVDDYVYPEASANSEMTEAESIALANKLMSEGQMVFWWYHSDYPDTLDLDTNEDNWVQGDWQTYAKVGRFSTMAELKAATEAVFTLDFCETHFYDKVNDYQKFHEIDGVLYHNLQSGGMGWSFSLPKEYSVKTIESDTIVSTAACDGLDPESTTGESKEYEFDLMLKNIGGEWKLNNWYSYSPEGWDAVEILPLDKK